MSARHFVFLLLLASDARASVRLDDVLSSVEAHHPMIRASLRDLDKAKAEATAARGGFDPSLKMSYLDVPQGEYVNRYFDAVVDQPTPVWGSRVFAGYRQGSGSFGPYDLKMLTETDGEVRAGLEIPILRGGLTDERRTKIETTRAGQDIATAQMQTQLLETKRQATHKYFEWLAYGAKIRIAQNSLKLATDRDQVMSHRVNRGDASEIERIDNQRTVLQRRAAEVTARRGFQKAALELSLYYRNAEGEPLRTDLTSVDEKDLSYLDQDDSPRVSPEALAQHPETRRLEGVLLQTTFERTLAKNLLLPTLNAEISTSQDFGDSSSPKKGIQEYRFMVKFEMPLYLRTARGRREAADATRSRAEYTMQLTRERLRVNADDAELALKAAKERLAFAKDEFALSKRVEAAERTKMQHGDSTLLLLNLREQATIDSETRVVDAHLDTHKAAVDLRTALGEL